MSYPPNAPNDQPPQQPGGYPPAQPYPGQGGYPPSSPYPGQSYPPAQPYPGPGGYPPSSPYPGQGYPAAQPYPGTQPVTPDMAYGGYPPGAGYPVPPTPRRSNVGRFIALGAVILVLLVGGGAVLAIRTIKINSNAAYSTNVPGPGCDKGGGIWQDAADPTYTVKCQSNGMLLGQPASTNQLAEVYFVGKSNNYKFPQAYQVQTTVTYVSGSNLTSAGFEVHDQTPHGGQGFEIAPNGNWDVYRFEVNDQNPKRLAIGFVPAANSYTLNVDITGTVMKFSINGAVVDTIADPTYNSSDSIALQDSDAQQDSGTESVLFSKFSYTPETDAIGAVAGAQTATAVSTNMTPYQAATPGQSCDHNGGQWANPSTFGQLASVTCDSNGLQISKADGSEDIGYVRFYNLDGNFPQNYSVAATLDLSKIGNDCAGFWTRITDNAGRYQFLICGDGSWYVDNLTSPSADPQSIDTGTVAAQSTYMLKATVQGTKLTFNINGQDVSSQDDSTNTATSFIALVLYPNDTPASSVTFKNFGFTPLP